MKVAVIGAGAVGGAIAAALDRAGHELEVTARGAHLAAIGEHGIRLTGAWGEHRAAVRANPQLTEVPELAIVTTKTTDAEGALRQNAASLRGVPVLIIQNGVTALTTAHTVLPDNDIVGGLAVFAASLVEPGHVAITTPGPIYLGSENRSEALGVIASVLGAVLPVHTTQNFAGAQWAKLIVNQINALPAITGTSAQATIADRGLRRVLTRSIREAVGVAIDTGVRFERMQGLSHGLLRLLRWLPLWVAQLLPLFMKLRMGKVPNPGSTLQSIRRGQRTEVDYLNGAIVEAATASGMAAPINAALVELVHEVEESGKFFSAAEVVARVPH